MLMEREGSIVDYTYLELETCEGERSRVRAIQRANHSGIEHKKQTRSNL
jgi:hypothetical protein